MRDDTEGGVDQVRLEELRRIARVNIDDGVPRDPIPLASSEVMMLVDEILRSRSVADE